MQLLGRHLIVRLEVHLHQALVYHDRLVDHLRVRIVHGRKIWRRIGLRIEKTIHNALVTLSGFIKGQAFATEALMDLRKHPFVINVVRFDSCNRNHTTKALFFGRIHQSIKLMCLPSRS